ncbi:hypothetical protein DFH07DRAFT_767601 [Mycena maculata]|uniref:F-box domain-containing protein n=1 Tax=Mycena maculata TaxID=230809 RepID=A0AAD7JX07_9AGAR|nr:hypothetical protein DFH07DRAFT_767601 [Mycena maculata]
MIPEQVPADVWLEVFRWLPPDNILHLLATHRTFRYLCRPILFAHFDFHPYVARPRDRRLLPFSGFTEQVFFASLFDPPDRLCHPPVQEVCRSLERLNFWSSDDIAPFVRSCHLSRRLGSRRKRDASDGDKHSPFILLDAFFERLASFTEMQRLYIDGVCFTPMQAASLSRLSRLTRLDTHECIVDDHEAFSQVWGLARFSIRTTGSFTPWISLLRSDLLRELEGVELIGEICILMPTFPNVYKLAASMDFRTMAQNVTILSKFPAVQIFELKAVRMGGMFWESTPLPAGPSPLVLPSNILPVLQDYSGACDTLHIFIPRATLTRLSTFPCRAENFLRQLAKNPEPTGITSLKVDSHGEFGAAWFDTLFGFFPHLVELEIIFRGVSEATKLLETLVHDRTLPSLIRLVLSLRPHYRDKSNPRDYVPFRDALLARCPTLTALWLWDGINVLWWRRLTDKTVDQGTQPQSDYKIVNGMLSDFCGTQNPISFPPLRDLY